MLALFCILIVIASGVALVVSFVNGSMLLSILGSLFCIVLFVALHELSHLLACKVVGSKVSCFQILFVKYQDGKLSLANNFLKAFVTFTKNNKTHFVFLAGFLCSLVVAVVFGVVYFVTTCKMLFVPFICSVLVLLGTFLMGSKCDLAMFVNSQKNKER